MSMLGGGERGRVILLPPCRVCGGQASGLHFGVNTCEACKAFFRRCLKRKETHTCAREQKCEINTETKSFCAYCRYQKCLKVGMSVEAVKTGRYTLERKAELLREMGHTTHLTLQEGIGLHENVSIDSWEETDAKRRRRDADTENMARLVCSVTDSFRSLRPYSPELLRDTPEHFRLYHEEQQMLEEIFGPMKPHGMQYYTDMYQATDTPRDRLTDTLPRVERSLMNLVRFARSLPGFAQLHGSDQSQLLRRSSFMWWVINSYGAVNVEQNCFTSYYGKTLTKEEMRVLDYQGTDKVDRFFDTAKQLQNINPDDETQALMMAACLTSTEDCQLVEPNGTSLLQNQFIEALDLHLKNTRERHLQVLGRIMVVISQVRQGEQRRNTPYPQQNGFSVSPYLGEYFYNNVERDRYHSARVPEGAHNARLAVTTSGQGMQMQGPHASPIVCGVSNYLPNTSHCVMAPPLQPHQSQHYSYPLPFTHNADPDDMRYISL